MTHIKIHYDGDCFQLVSLDGTTSEPFASLGDLVQHCMESDKAIPLKDGGYIELTVPIISEDPTTERYFLFNSCVVMMRPPVTKEFCDGSITKTIVTSIPAGA